MKADRSCRSINFLLALALVTDLLTPFLIWKGILPAYTRWASHAALIFIMLVLCQVKGQVRVALDEWTGLDIEYINHHCLWLDLKIMLLTIPATISGCGAV